jgi:hypothetical protein
MAGSKNITFSLSMADTNYIDIPTKDTPLVDDDEVLIQDSEEFMFVKRAKRSKFQ